MRTRIGTQLFVGVGLTATLSIAVMAALLIGTHRNELIAERVREADMVSETIKSSTHYDMMENRRQNLHRQIETIGRQGGIQRVRVFNKEGRIMFSSDALEIGHAVDKRGEACYACHAEGQPLEALPITARSRIFRDPGGDRVLGMINPIQNEAGCYTAACHAHDKSQSVLGVLDVTISLAEVDSQIAASQGRMAGVAVLALASGALMLWWLNRRLLVGPVAALTEGTRRVAEGDLTTTIPVQSRHELGDLARAFNTMIRNLADAQRQLVQAEKLASVGRLAAGVAHEINNPLTGVLTYSSLLLRQLQDRPEMREDLEIVVRETKRCRDIVKGLLDFARQSPPQRQKVDLNEVVRRAVAVVMNRLRINRVALNLELTADLPAVDADANQMQQVVVNLLLNASDAVGRAGGRIQIASHSAALEPWGHAVIRQATCPAGCDLLAPQERIGGLPAIKVARRHGGREWLAHLDPVYGRFNRAGEEPCEDGVEGEALCPRCRTSLILPERTCGKCGAPLFAVLVPGEGRVEWCVRKGCHEARWEAREAAGAQQCVELVVEDSGCGIPPEALDHLFEPFYTTKGRRGTGLGLAVSWGIVEAHGGTIDVASRAGAGTRFTVRLPLMPRTAASAAA
jgi:two-component system NtrC family sensor kinase